MNTERHQISRLFEIDAAHRVPFHGSKCRSPHGHRYKLDAVVEGPLGKETPENVEAGMVMDFGFLKGCMEEVVDKHCDHGSIYWLHDRMMIEPIIASKFGFPSFYSSLSFSSTVEYNQSVLEWHRNIRNEISTVHNEMVESCARQGYYFGKFGPHQEIKLYVVPFIPTAENLARHWHKRLQDKIKEVAPLATLVDLRVYETPNCWSDYPGYMTRQFPNGEGNGQF